MNHQATLIEPRLRDIGLLLACRPHRALAIAWWRLCGKRQRARNRLQSALAGLPLANERMIETLGKKDIAVLSQARNRQSGADDTIVALCVHLHIDQEDSHDAARRAVVSVLRQSHTVARLIVTGTGPLPSLPESSTIEIAPGPYACRIDGLQTALEIASRIGAQYLVPLASDANLTRHALAAYAAQLLNEPSVGGVPPILYGDQDEFATPGRGAAAWLKPEWDRRMILSQDYASVACALPVSAVSGLFRDTDGAAPDDLYAIFVRAALDDVPVRHVPRITTRTAPGDWQQRGASHKFTIERALGSTAQVEPGPFGTIGIHWPLPNPNPGVSILVATRDRVELLRTCVDGLLHATDYPAFEIIIVDNASRDPETLAYMDKVSADPRVRVVRWPHPFNYSAINNYGASFATEQFLCLLNNDIEILEPDWLSEMVREAVQPGVGAVGARLLYPDRSIQHAGVAIGLGNAAGHAHRALPEGEPGYFAQALIARGASAVTGACLLVEKRHFDAVGGLDEDHLAVAYNDVDLCLKLEALGLANIYTPAATLIHHESKSRGLDFAPEHLARYLRELATFQDRWDTQRVVDPWHHPWLDRESEVFRASF